MQAFNAAANLIASPVRPPLTRKRSNSSPSVPIGRPNDQRPRRSSHVSTRPKIVTSVHAAHHAGGRHTQAVVLTTSSPFSKLPAELLIYILEVTCWTVQGAQLVSSLSHYARRLALPYLFGTRSVRSTVGALSFQVYAATKSTLTPVGALVTRLWLSDTLFWPVESVRAILRACPNVEDLALTSLRRISPWGASPSLPGLFDGCTAPLKLTLTGYTTAEDVTELESSDPATFAGLSRRLHALSLLKLRSAFHDRLAGILPPVHGGAEAPPEGENEEHQADAPADTVIVFLQRCRKVKVFSVPWVQVEELVVHPGTQKPFVAEISLVDQWTKAASEDLARVELLLDPTKFALDGPVAIQQGPFARLLKAHVGKVNGRLVVVDWPRNIDLARGVWLSRPTLV